MTRAILVFGFLFLSSSAVAGPVDLPLLRQAICQYETRGEADPDDAVGASGEIGRCQIRPATARQLGFKGKNRALFNRETNEAWADAKIQACATGHNPYRPWRKYVARRRVETIADCYHNGLLAGPRSGETWKSYAQRLRTEDSYVRGVFSIYQELIRERKIADAHP